MDANKAEKAQRGTAGQKNAPGEEEEFSVGWLPHLSPVGGEGGGRRQKRGKHVKEGGGREGGKR